MARQRRIGIGHNGGPLLKEKRHVPPWGRGGVGHYFTWKAKHRAAWRPASTDILLRRQEKAESLGLSYEEYTLEILERGVYRRQRIRRRSPRSNIVGSAVLCVTCERQDPSSASSAPGT